MKLVSTTTEKGKGKRIRTGTSEHAEYFVDEQRVGPYAMWHHEHHFAPAAGGLRMTDHVTYEVGWGPAGWVAERLRCGNTCWRGLWTRCIWQKPSR